MCDTLEQAIGAILGFILFILISEKIDRFHYQEIINKMKKINKNNK